MDKIKQLIIIGDSGVYGWGDRDSGGWAHRLKMNWMKEPGAPIIYPLGIRGDGLEKVTKRWKEEWLCRGELRRKVPDGIILAVGLNDTARIGNKNGREQLSPDAYQFGLEQLLNEIKKHTSVMMIGLTAVDESVMPFAGCLWYSNEASSLYESKIEEACLNTDVPFLPLFQEMIKEPSWIKWMEPDGIHLNSEGHYWIYQKIIYWKSLLKWADMELVRNITYIN